MTRDLIGALVVASTLVGCAVAPTPPPSSSGGSGAAAVVQPADAYAHLSDDDVGLATAALQRALEREPDGGSLPWRNAKTGRSGSFKPLRSYVTSNGYFCRSYEEEIGAAAESERFRHDACRNEEGVWIWL